VAGFEEAPQQAIFCDLTAGQITKNEQLWPHLLCLPVTVTFLSCLIDRRPYWKILFFVAWGQVQSLEHKKNFP
jgi:hypothetical protein